MNNAKRKPNLARGEIVRQSADGPRWMITSATKDFVYVVDYPLKRNQTPIPLKVSQVSAMEVVGNAS